MTAESFAKWTIAKAARKQVEAEARVKAEQNKRKIIRDEYRQYQRYGNGR